MWVLLFLTLFARVLSQKPEQEVSIPSSISTPPPAANQEGPYCAEDHMPYDDRVSLLHTRMAPVQKKQSFKTLTSSQDINLQDVVVSDRLAGGLKPSLFIFPHMAGKDVTLMTLKDKAGGSQSMWTISEVPGEPIPFQVGLLKDRPLIVKKPLAQGGEDEYEGLRRMDQAGILIPEAEKFHAKGSSAQFYAMANLQEVHGSTAHKIDDLLGLVYKSDCYRYQFGFDLGTIHLVDIATGNPDRLPRIVDDPGAGHLWNVFVTDDTREGKWRLVGLDSGNYLNNANYLDHEMKMLKSWEYMREAGVHEYARKMIQQITTQAHAENQEYAELREFVIRGFADALVAQPDRHVGEEKEKVGLSIEEVNEIRHACVRYLAEFVQEHPESCRKKRAQEVKTKSQDQCAKTTNHHACMQTIATRVWNEVLPMPEWEADVSRDVDAHCDEPKEMTDEEIAAMFK